jgi:hypothetical protein
MQNEIKQEYDNEDWDKASYLVDKGFVKRNHVEKYDDIRECAINIHTVKMRGYDEYTKNGGTPAFEGKTNG